MRGTTAVFLNRKLISCDTILPLLMEIKRANPARRIEVWVPDRATQDVIATNRVLGDMLASIAKTRPLSGRHLGPARRKLHQVTTALRLALLAAKGLLGHANFIHFKALAKKPLDLLYKLCPDRTYLAENDSYGFSRLMAQVTFLTPTPPEGRPPPPAGVLIAFSPEWHQLSHHSFAGKRRFLFGTPRRRKSWIAHIRATADRYLEEDFRAAGLALPDEFLAVMLGFFGPLPYLTHPSAVEELLDESLREMADLAEGRPILLKPHAITDMAVLQRVLDAQPKGRFLVSYLHPMVLATRSRLVLANYFSTTLADFTTMGVPTIEYTQYRAEALALTGGGSMRPEYVRHFVNRDRAALREVLSVELKGPRPAMPPVAEGPNEDDLIQELAWDRPTRRMA